MRTPSTLLLVALLAATTTATSDCPAPRLKIDGNVTLVAVLDGHSGDMCNESEPRGLQEMATVAWAVNAFNHAHFLPARRKIGLTLFDGCSSTTTSQKALLSALNDHACSSHVLAPSIGVVLSPKTASRLSPLTTALRLPTSSTATSVSSSPLFEAVADLLAGLHVRTVDHVLLPSRGLIEPISAAARQRGVCLLQVHVGWGGGDLVEGALGWAGIVLALGNAKQMASLGNLTRPGVQLVAVPLGDLDDAVIGGLPVHTVLLTANPVILRPPGANTPSAWASVGRQLFLDVSMAVMDAVQVTSCNASQCPPSDALRRLVTALRMRSTDDNAVFYSASRKQLNGAMELLAEFKLQPTGSSHLLAMASVKNVTLSTLATLTTASCDFAVTNSTANDFLCRRCVNRRFDDDGVSFEERRLGMRGLAFRPEPWAAALAAVLAVGALATLAVGMFILVRLCKGDVLEGSPGLSLLLLAAILLTYLAVAPFVVSPAPSSGWMCHVRLHAPALAYAVTFSAMLARSLMLASCDDEGGFLSHVNGYIQTTLCFLALAVQVALSTQFVLLNPRLDAGKCAFFSSGLPFLSLLSYDAFLLLVLVATTPFTARSKRNYREGAFFTAGAIVVTLVWAGWIALYLLLPSAAQDALVAVGLTATGSAVLVCVFIPRTYLMASAVARDNIANALPALAYNSSSVVDLNYRSSTQALYATVAPRGQEGVSNPNYYSTGGGVVTPPPALKKAATQGKKKNAHKAPSDNGTDSTYERYDIPPSPPNVTRF